MCCRFRFFCLFSQTADLEWDKTDKPLIPINRLLSSIWYKKSLFTHRYVQLMRVQEMNFTSCWTPFIFPDRAGVCFHSCHNSNIIKTIKNRLDMQPQCYYISLLKTLPKWAKLSKALLIFPTRDRRFPFFQDQTHTADGPSFPDQTRSFSCQAQIHIGQPVCPAQIQIGRHACPSRTQIVVDRVSRARSQIGDPFCQDQRRNFVFLDQKDQAPPQGSPLPENILTINH